MCVFGFIFFLLCFFYYRFCSTFVFTHQTHVCSIVVRDDTKCHRKTYVADVVRSKSYDITAKSPRNFSYWMPSHLRLSSSTHAHIFAHNFPLAQLCLSSHSLKVIPIKIHSVTMLLHSVALIPYFSATSVLQAVMLFKLIFQLKMFDFRVM